MRGSVMKRGKTWSYVLYLGRDRGREEASEVGRRVPDATPGRCRARRCARPTEQGNLGRRGRMTVAEYLDEWLAGIRPTVRDKTAASYEATLHDWVLPRIGSQQLVDLNATRLRALYAELLESGRRDGKGGLAPRSVQYAHRILFHALKDATEAGLLSRNPASLVRAPRVPKREMTVWSAEEARRVPRLARGRPAVRALGPHDHDRRPSRRGARTAVARRRPGQGSARDPIARVSRSDTRFRKRNRRRPRGSGQ